MRIDVLTTFPRMFDSVMGTSMMRIAQEKRALQFNAYDLRDWTHDRHRTTDDEPYGGGAGLVMKCAPIFEAYDDISSQMDNKPYVIFPSPQGEQLDEALVRDLAERDNLLFICGHYEGIDERAYSLADRRISIGDYVLTGGELASMVIIDAVVRKLDGVLGDAASPVDESFADGLLEYPQYTRPATYRDLSVPDVLLSGDHAKVDAWRHEQSLLRTRDFRPDLLERADLTSADRAFLESNKPSAK